MQYFFEIILGWAKTIRVQNVAAVEKHRIIQSKSFEEQAKQLSKQASDSAMWVGFSEC
jgi:hypothetical protein